jgi:hypothetical protein
MIPQQIRAQQPVIDTQIPNWLSWVLGLALASGCGLVAALLATEDVKFAVVLIGLPIFALGVRFPRITLYLCVFLFPLSIGMPRGLFGLPIFRPGEAILIVAFGAIMINRLFHYPWRIGFTPIDMGMFILFICGILIPLLVATWRGQQITTDNMNVLVGPIRFYMIYLMVRAVVHNKNQLKHVLHAGFAASIIVSVLGICQKYNLFGVPEFLGNYYMDASTREFLYLTWRNPDLFRITSVFNGSWNTVGSYLSFMLLTAIYYAETLRSRISLVLISGVIAIDGLALVLSGNVSSTSALIGGIILGSLYLRRLPKTVTPLIFGAILAAIFFSDFVALRFTQQFGSTSGDTVLASSFSYRIMLWVTEFLPALEGRWLLGVGPDLPPEVWWGTEESQYLFLLYKGGILYLIAYLLWAALAVAMCFLCMLYSSSDLARMLSIACGTIVIGLMYMGISNAYATYSAPMAHLWIMMALVSSASIWSKEDAPPPRSAATHAPMVKAQAQPEPIV